MGKKLNVSDERKAEIKKNADAYINNELAPATRDEQQYINKIRAGRERNATAIKNSNGTFAAIPEQFLKKVVTPAIEEYNARTGKKSTLKDYLKESDNRQFLQDYYLNDTVQYTYQPGNLIDKALASFKGKKIQVTDQDGNTVSLTKAQFEKRVHRLEQVIKEIGGFTFYARAEFTEGFTKMNITMPKLKDTKTIDDYEDFTTEDFDGFKIITSDKQKKK